MLVLATVAIGAVWSGETGVYCLGTAAAGALYDAALCDAAGSRRVRLFASRTGIVLAVYVGSLLAFTLLTRALAGAWPNWNVYLDFVRLYTVGGFGNLPVASWSPALALAAVYVASLIALVLVAIIRPPLDHDQGAALRTAAGLTAFGALSFTYFLGRAHPYNLLHVSPPGVVLVFLWLGIIRTSLSQRGRLAGVAIASSIVVAFTGTLIVASAASAIRDGISASTLASVLGQASSSSASLHALWDGPVVTPAAVEVEHFAQTLGERSYGVTILTTPERAD